MSKVYNKLEIDNSKLINCLIVYPDLSIGEEMLNNIENKKRAIDAYVGVHKLGVKLPLVSG